MRIVVGLGNPGPEYRGTRHNVGFRVVEELRRRHDGAVKRREARSLVAVVRLGQSDIALARPQTFMNRSGAAVADLLKKREASPGELLVVCDDLHLDVGTIRLRARGSHGGHNGLRSIIETLGTSDFPRLRIGVGPAEQGVEHADFVLREFRRDDRPRVEEMIALAADCAEMIAAEGLASAMNRYNGRPDAGVTDAGAVR